MVTGVSGAGKSSLALDTLYAEGQRRYVETFSPYTRAVPGEAGQTRRRPDRGYPAGDRAGAASWPAIRPEHGRHDHRDPRRSRPALRPGRARSSAATAAAGRARVAGDASRGPSKPGPTARATRSPFRSMSGPRRPGRPDAVAAREGFTRLARRRASRPAGRPGARPARRRSRSRSSSIAWSAARIPPERRADSIETAFEKGLGRCRVIAGDRFAGPTFAAGAARLRDRSPRAPAQPVPLQQPPGGLPRLRGSRPDDRARPGPHRARPVEDDPRRGARALVDAGLSGLSSRCCWRCRASWTFRWTSRSSV